MRRNPTSFYAGLVDSSNFDELDRQLVHALQLDGRASFARIAEVLGVSDQTVARRYTRLRGTGHLHVLGLTNPAALGQTQWLIRVRCTPGEAASVAEALARRDDTAWVTLTSGGTEITCVTRTDASQDDDSLLLQRLPRTRAVLAVQAFGILHTFFGGALSLVSKTEVLNSAQIAALRRPSFAFGTRPTPLDDADRAMLAVLERDGRASASDLASASGLSPSSVRRRLDQLVDAGILYFDVHYDARMFGLTTNATLWLSVAPSRLEATGLALAKHPEVAYSCATTGPTNLYAVVITTDIRALYRYLTTRIATLDAVRQVETLLELRRVKAATTLPRL